MIIAKAFKTPRVLIRIHGQRFHQKEIAGALVAKYFMGIIGNHSEG
jgi:hypothetical protein